MLAQMVRSRTRVQAPAGTPWTRSTSVAKRPGARRRHISWRCTLFKGNQKEFFFWERRGKALAELFPSLKTCRRNTITATDERRRREREIEINLQTIHPNPGPRDKTEEGKRARRERRKEKRNEKRRARINTTSQKSLLNVITWNVQRVSLRQRNRRRLREIAEKANKNNWDAVLLSEVNGEGQGTIWLGEDEKLIAIVHTNKAAILLRGQTLQAWCEQGQITKHSQRSISIKTMGHSLTSTYLPVWRGNNEAEIEEAKEDLRLHIQWANKDEVLIVGGDFNAHIGGNEDRANICGKFGLRETNRQGQELLDFCEENNLCYVNSFSNHKRRGTWFNPALRRWYELDGFLMKNSQRHNLVRKICTLGEFSLSDHKPKRMTLVINKPKKKIYTNRKKTPKINWERLKDDEIATRYRDRVELLLEEQERTEPYVGDSRTKWNELTEVVTKAAEDICGTQEKKVLNPWMAGREGEIERLRANITGKLTQRNDLMERQREADTQQEADIINLELQQTKDQLKQARTELQRKTRQWEKDWWSDIVDECKEAGERGDTGAVYKKLKELGTRGMTRAPESTNLTKEEFKVHFQKISKDRFENDPEEMEATADLVEDISETEEATREAEILNATPSREEILKEMKKMKESAPGEDGVRLIYLFKGGPEVIEKVIEIVQFMFEYGAEKWEDSLKSGLVIPLFKKGDRNNVNNYRGVCLLAMGSRILARIMASRLRVWSENLKLIDDDQAGFRKNRSTCDVTQMMYRIQEDTKDLIKRADAADITIEEGEMPGARLLDLKKAYPRVNKPMLWKILQKYGARGKGLRVIMDLHETTFYKIKSREGTSESWVPQRGLREGCPSSPVLFNIFHQVVMRQGAKARKRKADETGLEVGISYCWIPGSTFPSSVKWEKSGNSEAKRIRIDKGLFADDTTIAGKKKELEQGVQETKKIMNKFEERNNDDKEEELNFGREDSSKIRMLGCYMGETEDTKQRIKRAGATWFKVKNRLKGSKLSKTMQARVIEACVESTLLFDCQARTWQVTEINRLQRTMDKKYRWLWSKKIKPPLIQMQEDGYNMQDVRNELNVKSVRWKIEKRVLERIGHVFRMDDDRTVKAVVLGWMEDLESYEKVPGRKRKTILYWKRLLREAGIDWTQIGQLTEDRSYWKATVTERMNHLHAWERSRGKRTEDIPGQRNVERDPEEEFICSYEDCGLKCESKTGLIIHRKRVHEKSNHKNLFSCEKCGENFDFKGYLKNHIKVCTGIRSVNPETRTCDKCNRTISKKNFSRHRKSCNPEPEVAAVGQRTERIPCEYCGGNISKPNIARHRKKCRNGDG